MGGAYLNVVVIVLAWRQLYGLVSVNPQLSALERYWQMNLYIIQALSFDKAWLVHIARKL